MEMEISVSGEEDVGIPSDGATVTMDNWDIKYMNEEDREELRKLLKDCFREIFDQGEPDVTFEDEFPDERKGYEEYINNLSRDELIKTLMEDYDKQYGK